MRPSLVAGVVAALAAGCASDPPTVFTPARDAGATPVDGGARDSGAVTPIPLRDAGAAAGCSEAAQLVYVLSDQNELYSFRPNLRQFTRIGALGCPRSAGSPNSMAIDRDAVAWVNYVQSGLGDSGGAIDRVNTRDASCTAAAPVRMPAGWYRLGMGFSTVSADDPTENLFVASTPNLGGGSQGLGSVETGRGLLHIIGNFSGAFRGQSAELTGTGDGRLFGFFTTSPVQVAQLDRATGAVLDATPLPGVETPQAWAFSFWGGDFYLYTAPAAALSARTTNVTRYRPSDGSIDPRYMTDIGFRIVGAGVSTCAPIAPPP
jgi:hypothetical protein